MGDCANRESRVLVLEDEAVLRRSLTRLLERRGLMVVAAATLQEARAHLRGTDIDAAILDVSLPDGDGLDLLPLTHADHSLVVSAEVTRERLQERGVEHFQRKPLDLRSVAETIDRFLSPDEAVGVPQ